MTSLTSFLLLYLWLFIFTFARYANCWRGENHELKFSIVAPMLNEMPNVENLFLRSLAQQTFKDFEIIIVDGGSTDGSVEACLWSKRVFDLDLKLICDRTRNIGYIRNVGAKHAKGEIIFQTSTDVYFEPRFFEGVDRFFREHKDLTALGGRTFPVGSTAPLVTHLGHGFFDFIRFVMSCRFMPVKKLRPSGNFLAVKRSVFEELGGYPNVPINEDGLFGYKLDEYWRKHRHKTCYFSLKFKIYHHVKRFQKKGGLSGILFYIYVFRMVFPFLKPLLYPIERRSGVVFASRREI